MRCPFLLLSLSLLSLAYGRFDRERAREWDEREKEREGGFARERFHTTRRPREEREREGGRVRGKEKDGPREQKLKASDVHRISKLAEFYVVDDVALSVAGVLTRPLASSDVKSAHVSDVHAATLVPGQVKSLKYTSLSLSLKHTLSKQVRGNHIHISFAEVITLVHGRFHVRLSRPSPLSLSRSSSISSHSLSWESEDLLIEVDSSLSTPPSPDAQYDFLPSLSFHPFSSSSFPSPGLLLSSSPISMRVPPRVCHALRTPNASDVSISFFASYYVRSPLESEEAPDRGVCRGERAAFLDSRDSRFDFPIRL